MKRRLWKRQEDFDLVIRLRRDASSPQYDENEEMLNVKQEMEELRQPKDIQGHCSVSRAGLVRRPHATPLCSSKNCIRAHRLILAQSSTFFETLFVDGHKMKQIPKLYEQEMRIVNGNKIKIEGSDEMDFSGNYESGKRPVWTVDISHLFQDSSLRPIEIKWFKKAVKSMYSGQFPGIPKGEELICYKVLKLFGFQTLRQVLVAYLTTFLPNPVDACTIIPEAFRRGHSKIFEMSSKVMEKHASTIFGEPDLLCQWDETIFKHTLREGAFNVSEEDVFDFAVKWCKRKSEEGSKTLAEQFKEIEEFIRYPLILPDFIAEQVETTGLVSPHLIEEAYMYHAISSTLRDEYFKNNLRCKPRGSVRMEFKWEVTQAMTGITSSTDGTTITMNTSGCKTIFGDTEITGPGIYFWEVELVSTQSPCYCMVGVGSKTRSHAFYLGNSVAGWALYLFNSTAYHNGATTPYGGGGVFSAGTRVGVILSAKSRSTAELYFIINGKSGGRAFSDVQLPVFPAVTLAHKVDVMRLAPNPVMPSNWKHRS